MPRAGPRGPCGGAGCRPYRPAARTAGDFRRDPGARAYGTRHRHPGFPEPDGADRMTAPPDGQIVSGTRQLEAWRARVMPPVEQLASDLWSIPVPIPDNPLRYV